MKTIRLLLVILLSQSAYAQVVNIESQRMHTDSLRRSGELDFNYSYFNVNSKAFSVFSSNLSLQQKSKNLKSIFLLLGSMSVYKASGEKLQNANFLHLRYNRKVSRFLRWEVFSQVQSNLPIGVRVRYLAGTGPRFKLVGTAHFSLYLATLYMYEYEKTTDLVKSNNHYQRNSSYCSFSITIPKLNAELISTTYYQPAFYDFHDYRVYTENKLEFAVTKRLKLQTTYNYSFDSRPPIGINNYTTALQQGFSLKL